MADAMSINQLLQKHKSNFAALVDFNHLTDKLITLDFTANNTYLEAELLKNTSLFSKYIQKLLDDKQAKFGIGGFFEHRTIYARSQHFDTSEQEPRRLHLGVDIWGDALTPVYSFMDSTVHSFAFNNHFGDYGATIILQHELESQVFYSLYGHLSLSSIANLKVGQSIKKGEGFCYFGKEEENGHWPPHLHFQLIADIENHKGDYPGVAKFSEKEIWLTKIPDANLAINL